MKKKIIFVVSVIAILALALGGMFLIDKNRMDNNKPVIFSTWGYQYVPPVDISQESIFNVEEYIKDVNKYISIFGETTTFDIALTEEIYGKDVTDFKQTLEIEDVWGNIITDEKSFVTIIPMPDFLDNQTYYFKGDKLVAYREDFIGIGGSVTYYFKDNEIVYIDESKIEKEMVFEAENEKNIIERSNNVYERILKAKNVTIPVKEKEDAVTERSFIATIIEEEPSYLIVEPSDGEIEKQQIEWPR